MRWSRSMVPDELAGAVESLLENPRRAAEIGGRARALAMAKRGTADRVVQQILAAADEVGARSAAYSGGAADARDAGCDLDGRPLAEHRSEVILKSWIRR